MTATEVNTRDKLDQPRAVSILLVEDDHAIADALRTRLLASGYQVMLAPDGISAIAVAKHTKPDALLLDISLPGKDGFEALAQIREELGEVPVVFMTASRQPATRHQATLFTHAWYLEKPFTTPFLLDRLNAAVSAGQNPD